MSTKNVKAGLSKANVNAIAGAIGTATLNRLVPIFSTSVAYEKGQYTNYNNQLYRFTADKAAGAWDSSKVESASLNDLIHDVNEAVATINDKANVNGNYPTMTVGFADNLTPYDESAGDDQDEPFILQATGTGNGTQPDFSTGSGALMKEKQGNSVVVNQLNNNDGTTGTNADITYTKNNDGSWTLSGTASALSYRTIHTNISFVNGHKYLLLTTKPNENVGFYVYNNEQQVYPLVPTYGNSFVFTSSYTLNANLVFIVKNATDLTTALTTKVYLVDLTQWFNNNIPQDLLDNPDHFFRYYQGSLAYNAGELVNANGRYIKCIGRQQWDEETESGYIRSADGVKINDSSKIRMKNPIRVIPNTTYYYKTPVAFYICCYDENMNFIKSVGGSTNGTFTTPSNCVFIQAGFESAYGTTYNHDITISIYYEDESGYDQYYPYEVLTNNDTGNEVLRQAGSVKDYKEPSGLIHYLVGTRAYQSGDENDSTLTTDGTNTYYPLDEPYTEQGTPYSENLFIDDFGSMDFQGTSGVPQGALIFYPVDYKAFIDTLYKYTDGAPSKIALKTDLPTAPQSWAESLPGYDATKTQILKNVNGTLTWADDE